MKKDNILANNESMYSLLKDKTNNYKNRIALTYGMNKLRYNSFIKRIDEYSLSFLKLGVSENDIVTIILPNMIDTIICIYALNKIGAISNILHHLSSEEEIKTSVKDTDSKVLITYENKLNDISNIKEELNLKNIIYVNNSNILDPIDKIKKLFKSSTIVDSDFMPMYKFRLLGKHSICNYKVDFSIDKTALIINYNSKKIVLTNNNLNSYALNFTKLNEIFVNEFDVFTDCSILNSIPIIHRSLINAQNIIIDSKNNSKSIIDTIYKYKPNILEITPSTIEHILLSKNFKNSDLSYIRFIICGKDILNEYLYNKLTKFLYEHNSDASIVITFGCQEATSNIAMSKENEIDCFDTIIENTKIKIVNLESKKECKINEIGQICISGPTIMKEYYKDDKTDKVLIKDKNGITWLYSNDLGFIDSNNNLHFKSNIKRLIISNGIEIYPEEIENIIKRHKYIKDVSIVGVPHPYKKEVVKAYLVLKDGLVLNSEIKKDVKEYCEKNIPKYALPYAYGYRKELPKTNYGKIAYNSLINLKNEEE